METLTTIANARYLVEFVNESDDRVFDSFHNVQGPVAAAYLHLQTFHADHTIFFSTCDGCSIERPFGTYYYVRVTREEA